MQKNPKEQSHTFGRPTTLAGQQESRTLSLQNLSEEKCSIAAVPIQLATRNLHVRILTSSFPCTQFSVGLLPTRPKYLLFLLNITSPYIPLELTTCYCIARISQTHCCTLTVSHLAQFFLSNVPILVLKGKLHYCFCPTNSKGIRYP